MAVLKGAVSWMAAVIAAVLLFTLACGVRAASDNVLHRKGLKRIIVTYDERLMKARSWRSSVQTKGVSLILHSPADKLAVLEGPSATLTDIAMRLPGVIRVEEEKIVRAHAITCRTGCKVSDMPTRRGGSEIITYGLQLTQASAPAESAGPETVTGKQVSLCVLDTGILTTHSDLIRNNFTGCTSTSEDCPYVYNTPSDAHGTHVAGTIAALRNDQGTVGVISNGTDIHGVNVLPDSASGTTALVEVGLKQCEDKLDVMKKEEPSARMVINMSFGGPDTSESLQAMLDRLYSRGDVLLVSSSGNEQNRTPGAKSYPASYDSVISVGAVNCNSTIAPFSQQNEQVELVAPGQNVRSAILPWVPPLVAFNITTTRGTVLRGFNFQPVRDSGLGDIRGEVRNCGSMTRACPSASGKVCLAWRGGNSFRCKHRLAQLSGCRALVFVHTVQLPACTPLVNVAMKGTTCPSIGGRYLPMATISWADGQRILKYMSQAAASTRKVRAGLQVSRGETQQQYSTLEGTSMAAPHVAAVAARIWANFPNCTAASVREALTKTAKDLGSPDRDRAYGYGLVQTVAAYAELSNMPCAVAAAPPASI